MNPVPVVILCGGQGTRMGDTLTKKELIDIGGRPLLWHVMRIFSSYQLDYFVLALGHLGDQVRRYFLEYEAMTRDVTLRLAHGQNRDGQAQLTFRNQPEHDPWHVTLVDTGLSTEKASRLMRLAPYLEDCER
ncbi:MAG: NTP transferase domain-containing protein, partial [Chloroflexota bacterium]